MVYFKRVVVKNLNTGKSIELKSRYGIYVLKGSKGDRIKLVLDIVGANESLAGLRIRYLGKEYNIALKGKNHIEKVFTVTDLPCTIDVMVGHYYPTPDDVLHVDDQRMVEIYPRPKPIPILHLDIPSHWEPRCSKSPCIISFTGRVYDATKQHRYSHCNITATIKDLTTGELSTVQTTSDSNGRFRITFKVRKSGKKKITVVAHTPDGRAEAEAIIKVTVPEPKLPKVIKKHVTEKKVHRVTKPGLYTPHGYIPITKKTTPTTSTKTSLIDRLTITTSKKPRTEKQYLKYVVYGVLALILILVIIAIIKKIKEEEYNPYLHNLNSFGVIRC